MRRWVWLLSWGALTLWGQSRSVGPPAPPPSAEENRANLILNEADAMGKRQALLESLANVTILSRGSKSTAALRKANIRIDSIPSAATTEGVIDALQDRDLTAKRIAVQLYGTPNPVLCSALERRGATVIPVSVYTYSPASDRSEIER